MKLYFYEFEKKNNELFGEFCIEENVEIKPGETYNIIVTILCDKDSKAIKEFRVLKQFLIDEDPTDSENITDSYKVEIDKFVKNLFEATKDNSFDKNFFNSCLVIFEK